MKWILVLSMFIFPFPREPQEIIFKDCTVPDRITKKIGEGVQFALDKQAAFFIDKVDLFHVHLLISKEKYNNLSGSIKSIDLMELTDAFLFHSLEEAPYRNSFSVEVRKRRNIFVDLRTNEFKILNTEEYPVDPDFYTIWQEEDLGFEEIFQVSFSVLPSAVDTPCKLSGFEAGPYKIIIDQILWMKPLLAGDITSRHCYCSGAVK